MKTTNFIHESLKFRFGETWNNKESCQFIQQKGEELAYLQNLGWFQPKICLLHYELSSQNGVFCEGNGRNENEVWFWWKRRMNSVDIYMCTRFSGLNKY